MHVGLLAAMPQELGKIKENLINLKSDKFGDLEIYSGEWENSYNTKIFVSVAWSGWGKISAARAATRLISTKLQNQKVDLVIFTGVAGAVDNKLKQWDVVISESVIQHDMDARPLFNKFVIPALNQDKIRPRKEILDKFYGVLKKKIKESNTFGDLYKGLIATGDMFISEKEKISYLSKEIPSLLAVEMEGAALAQVASQENIDWLIVRVISDGANESAHDDFSQFLIKYEYESWKLIKILLEFI